MTLDQFLKHSDTAGLLKAVASTPGDPLPRLLLADHAEERGFPNVAAGQRWAAAKGKHPATGMIPGGWYHPHPTRTEANDRLGHAALPRAFRDLDQVHPSHARLFTVEDPHEAEHHFVHASHALNWHPDSGEPMAPGTDEWSLPSTGTAEDPNHDRSQ
jgi:hypothetical protein